MQTDHAPDPATQTRLALEAQSRNGANWFFWIAGMSLVNSLVGLFGGQWGFVIGLGITQVIDSMLTLGDGSTAFRLVGPVLTAAVAAVFIAFGYFAREGRRWAFIAGIALYVLDSLLFVLVRDVLAIALHAFALYCLVKGLHAKDQLDRLPKPRPATIGLRTA
jgi:hypothetical protein